MSNFNLVRRETVNVPIVGKVAAGQPLLAMENVEGYFPIPSEFMPNNKTFMLVVEGDSMIMCWNFQRRLCACRTAAYC